MSVKLLYKCLDANFYNKHKSGLEESLFQPELRKFYATISEYYESHDSSLTAEELWDLYTARYPAQTASTREAAKVVWNNISTSEIGDEAAEELLRVEKLKLKAASAAQEAFNIADGKHRDIALVEGLVQDMKKCTSSDGDYSFQPITDDLEELVQLGKIPCKWKFHLEPFREQAEGVGDGTLSLIIARVNAGKTLLMTSLVFHPEGWAAQGAKILLLGNEEFAARTKIRGVSCYTGVDMRTVEVGSEQMRKCQEKYAEIADNVRVIDVVGMDFAKLEELIQEHTPDIVVIDQLDKVKVSGNFSGKHEEYGAIYIKAREVAKQYNCAVVGVSQASAEAEGKLYYSFDLIAGSKTDKAAECDLIITIGKEGYAKTQGNDNGLRVANFCKNKLTGNEGYKAFTIIPELSRIAL